MDWCNNVTDAAFVHLRGIHTLNMSESNQSTITDAAFVHLRWIHTLKILGVSPAAKAAAAALLLLPP